MGYWYRTQKSCARNKTPENAGLVLNKSIWFYCLSYLHKINGSVYKVPILTALEGTFKYQTNDLNYHFKYEGIDNIDCDNQSRWVCVPAEVRNKRYVCASWVRSQNILHGSLLISIDFSCPEDV